MSNFSTNFQFNVAQLSSLSKEQDKLKQATSLQQDRIAKKIEKEIDQFHSSITATEDKSNILKIEDNQKDTHQRNKQELSQHEHEKKEKDSTKKITFKEEGRGTVIDISC